MASREEAERCRDALEAVLDGRSSFEGSALSYDEDAGTWTVLLLVKDHGSRRQVASVPLRIVNSGAFRPDVLRRGASPAGP